MTGQQINDRIDKLISVLNKNPSSFAESLGVSSPVVHNIVKGRRSKPSYELIQKIISVYEVNASWLLIGRGGMWQKAVPDKVEKEIEIPISKQIENRINYLLRQLEEITPNDPYVMELTDLFAKMTHENRNMQARILALYEKQESLMDVLRKKLGVRV